MKTRLWFVAVVLALAALGGPSFARERTGENNPACVAVSGEARYQGLGYTHVVRIRNGCDRDARCEAWTDVDPERHAVQVASGQTGEVVTRRGSPASEFGAHASCSLERGASTR